MSGWSSSVSASTIADAAAPSALELENGIGSERCFLPSRPATISVIRSKVISSGPGDLVGAGRDLAGGDQGADDVVDGDRLGAAVAPARQQQHRQPVDELDQAPEGAALRADDHRSSQDDELGTGAAEDLLDLAAGFEMLAVALVSDHPAQIDRAPQPAFGGDGGEVLGGGAVGVGEAARGSGLHRVDEVVGLVHPLERRRRGSRGRMRSASTTSGRSTPVGIADQQAHADPLAQGVQQCAADEAGRSGEQEGWWGVVHQVRPLNPNSFKRASRRCTLKRGLR